MTTTSDADRQNGRLRAVVTTGGRLLADLLIIGLWVVFLGLAFLSTGWPRWAFYTLLLLGIVLYVQLTASWFGSAGSGDDSGSAT